MLKSGWRKAVPGAVLAAGACWRSTPGVTFLRDREHVGPGFVPPFSRRFSSSSALRLRRKSLAGPAAEKNDGARVRLGAWVATLLSPLVLAAGVLGLVTGIVAGFLPCLSRRSARTASYAWRAHVLSFGVQSPAVFVVAFAYGTLYAAPSRP